MKIHNAPTVYLLSKMELQTGELQRFLRSENVVWESDSPNDCEVLTEVAGRICYMSYEKPRPGGNSAYIGHILKVGHGSVLEHATWSFLCTGVSRSLTHELVRHRAGWAYSQLSQRYVDESVVEVVGPPDLQYEIELGKRYEKYLDEKLFTTGRGSEWRVFQEFLKENPDVNEEALEIGKMWIKSVRDSYAAYNGIAAYQTRKAESRGMKGTEAKKFARQSARSVLPNATETKITFTANARALRHFFTMRGSEFADPEIRALANAVYDVVLPGNENLFGDYTKTELPGYIGADKLSSPYPKV